MRISIKKMKEKDNIEKMILDNLDELNDNEPREGHFNRFEQKLAQQNKKKIISLNLVLKVAAVLVFALLVANQTFIYFSSENQASIFTALNKSENKKADDVTLASVSPEYEEVEFYYSNAINVGLNQWDKMIEQGLISEDEQKMMNNELSEFENVYDKLQNDLQTSPNDERVINAMLEYYQTKLSVINMVVNKLEEVKQKRNTNHETEM